MKKLYRSSKNKKIAGICAGLGEFFNIDPTIIRLVFVFLAILTGIVPFIIIYFVAIFIIPIETSEIEIPKIKKLYRSNNKIIAGVCSGIAEYMSVDSTIVRFIFVIICAITLIIPMFLLYLLAWIIIPKKPQNDE
jgi:phage shock protein PspC (stress-responsive transcriptional regulator)